MTKKGKADCTNGIDGIVSVRFTLFAVLAALALAAGSAPAFAQGCPSINAIGNFQPSTLVGASFTLTDPGSVGYNTLATYYFSSLVDESPSDGVPGLIKYCVYPSQPPANPDSATAIAVGANGGAWGTDFAAIQGYFAFGRPNGNPSNIPLDGTLGTTIGAATWSAGAPIDQRIVLHINDAAECERLYGGTSDTCFVLPGECPDCASFKCPGDTVACKQVVITEACTATPLTVPAFTKLHIDYLYTIQNSLGGPDMIFKPPTPKTSDINTGGGKDYFGCEQQPDPNTGTPGTFGVYNTYQSTNMKLDFKAGSGTCDQSRFFLTAPTTITLTSGQSITFTIDMVTRTNKGKKQEYTSLGPHLLNSGFTVKWFQSNDKLLHSYSTNVTPIYVNVVGSCSP